MKIGIVGGGISGLATAFYIRQSHPDVDIVLFEKESSLGGKMMTKEIEGFLFEAGSNGFLSNKPDTLELVALSGCDDILIRSNDSARKRFIYKDFLCPLPESPKAFLQSPLLTFLGKLRVAGEFFIPAKKSSSDETLQSFGYRRVGKEMTDVFLDAMVAGIFASKPDKISVNSAFPAVVKLEKEYGGLFRGMLAKKKKEAGPGGILMSFEKGVSHFIERLAQSAKIEICTGVNVECIDKNDSNYTIKTKDQEIVCDKVILSTPAYISSQLVKEIDSELSFMLDDIEYSPISIVGFGYNTLAHDLDGFGLLTTTSAHKEILGVLWDSSIFDDRAPQGKKSLRVMIGGQRNPMLALKSDQELIAIAKNGLKETMDLDANPDVVFVERYEKGIPNYRLGHGARMEKLFETLAKHSGLYLNANAYFGVGLNDCVSNSKKCAQTVIREL
ncbi:MAG: protoporphyrinogen oxidase [Sulfurospirillaceae bacterium]|nr:protoporphyrinogen oxidase [Sulfurospirillaceae bacterium]